MNLYDFVLALTVIQLMRFNCYTLVIPLRRGSCMFVDIQLVNNKNQES